MLATRRDTFITPITNCLGYTLKVRDDNGNVDSADEMTTVLIDHV